MKKIKGIEKTQRKKRKTKARARLLRRNLKKRFLHWKMGPSPLLSTSERIATTGEYTEFLKTLVEINSQTRNIEGVNRVQEVLARELKKLQFTCEWYSNPLTESGDLLLAERSGEINQFITLVGHADTVLKPFIPHNFDFFEDDHKVRGSGVIDDKGGLVVALGGLHLFLKDHTPKYSLRFISSPNEEAGSIGFLEKLRKFSEDSVLVLGFEPALEDGSIIESRRGNRWYNIKIQGKEAHAGRSQGQHVNAAHEFAKKVASIQKLTDYKKNTSVNIGSVQGGKDRYNIICGQVSAKLDVRFSNFKDRDQLHKSIEKVLNKKHLTSIDGLLHADTTYKIVDDCPPFSSNYQSRPFIKKYMSLIKSIEGAPCKSVKAGGAGDVNYMSKKGTIILDGLGAKGGGIHTEQEFIYLPSLVTRAESLALFLKHANTKLKTEFPPPQ